MAGATSKSDFPGIVQGKGREPRRAHGQASRRGFWEETGKGSQREVEKSEKSKERVFSRWTEVQPEFIQG